MRLADATAKTDIEKRRAIRHIRRVATGLSVCLVVVFAATFAVDEPGFGLLLVRAMAEAGLIGALADWFAVEALFRRPLGLPIPHTALLPSNQKRAARGVAEFIQRYFLNRTLIRTRILDQHPTRRAAIWLSRKDNSKKVADLLVRALGLALRNVAGLRLSEDLRNGIQATLRRAMSGEKLAGGIAGLAGEAMTGAVTDSLLLVVRDAIEQNRQKVVAVVRDRSRWWIASRVDEEIAGLLVKGVLSVIDELTAENTPLRTEFDQAIAGLFNRLHLDGTMERLINQARDHAFDRGLIETLLDRLEDEAFQEFGQRLATEPDGVAQMIATGLEDAARRLAKDHAACAEMDLVIADAAADTVVSARPAIAGYVTEVISGWDSAELVDKFETEFGRDLQFIRINGALLGAILGGLIFLLTHIPHFG
ncbi:hypothetical protein GCM10011316_31280 [Roseibium aquae]|uniref:DUF445 domain-containing protein n=1 Tax=Roseibium aquae TaxID=1323746 RepID=A0A916TM05_9HYPH|nr:DUF445 domain-containing protein [Roseibium aquae]GGB56948.1 hypothetical protein GCM10011316_31280 [Roseibium aquae]